MISKAKRSAEILKSLQYKTGLFGASRADVSTGYNKAWIRDNLYESLGLEAAGDVKALKKVMHALFDVFLKHENKIDWAIVEKPDAKHKYIHARVHPVTFEEFHEEWGNKQNDAVGFFLFRVGELEKKEIRVIRNEDDKRILQKLVYYLASIEYWQDKDNGVWEENEEVHASSVGACVAGLTGVSDILDVPEVLIQKGEETLKSLLPRESETKETDLALLSLIYPFDVVKDEKLKKKIIDNIEQSLVRQRGVIRYKGDVYYNKKGEAEWCFGFPWLARIYKDIGDKKKYEYYIGKTNEIINSNGEVPELYFANSAEHNVNSPLGWGHAIHLVAVGG